MSKTQQVQDIENVRTQDTFEYTAIFTNSPREETRVTIHATDLENAVHVTLSSKPATSRDFTQVEVISYVGEGSVVLKAEYNQ